MCAIQDHPSLEGIECGSYRRGVSRPLRMGALSGNHFQVVIRNIQCDSKHGSVQNKPVTVKPVLDGHLKFREWVGDRLIQVDPPNSLATGL